MKAKLSIEGMRLLATIYLIWGSTFLVIRYTLHNAEGFPPFLLATSRILTSGILLLVFAKIFGHQIVLKLNQIVLLGLTGAFLWIGGHALVIWGEQEMDSSYAALLFGAMPLWLLLFESILQRGKNLSVKLVFSAALGFAGLLLLVAPQLLNSASTLNGGSSSSLENTHPISMTHLLALIASPTFWALGTLIQSSKLGKNLEGISSLASAGYQQLFGGLGCLFISQFRGEIFPGYSHSAALGIAYLTIFGSVIAFGSYVRALQLLPTDWVMSFAYVNPVVATILGSIFLHEKITPIILLGMAFVVLGVIGLFKSAKPKA